ncbi:MAG TPA: sugar phosphate isomerase/epimerase [Terriglobia bacterium]|nr:sugar phosphate isomerase/epimerase [Terriglobia bacterium]
MRKDLSRRDFLTTASSLATVACTSSSSFAKGPAPGPRTLRLGGPIFLKSDDPAELAEEHRRLGYRAAYAPEVGINDANRIKAILKEFAARDVALAEVGAWVNMLDPDPGKRRHNLSYVQERLALAEMLGARCCVDIAGSFNPSQWDGPDPGNITDEFIDATVENCRHVIDSVKPTRTRFSIEMMPFTFPTGPDDYLRLIRQVDRKGFAVHLDVCNVINSPDRMYRNNAVIEECFRKLGPWIVSCHAKDLDWKRYSQVCLLEVVPGRGKIDYHAYLRGISRLAVDAPLMLEHLKAPEEYDEGRRYIQRVARDMGLSFGPEGT